jgi:WD40 repeat protein
MIPGVRVMRTINAHRKDVHGLAFAPDGGTLASVGGQSAAVSIWDVRTGEELHKLRGRADRGRAVACGPDGLIAAADSRNLVRVWRLPGGDPVARLALPACPAAVPNGEPRYVPADALGFLPTGKGLVTAAEHLRLWDLGPESPSFRECPTYHHGIQAIAVSADGARVAFASRVSIGCWWPGIGGCQPVVQVHAHVHALAFDPAGGELAAAHGYMVRVFDLDAARPRLDLAGHQGMVWKVSYTPDGSRLVTASSDGTVRFWDTRTGVCRGSFDWRAGKVRCVAVSPDGLTVASGGQDGRIVIADIEP